MNSNKSEIYGLTGFQLHMHVAEIPEQVEFAFLRFFCDLFSILEVR